MLDRIRTSSLQNLLDGYVATLADAARRVWPIWYGADLSVYDPSASGLFVNALSTVSAVIFLYGADNKLASIQIVHMDEAGATAGAAAVATILSLTALLAKIAHLVLDRTVLARLQAWRLR